MIHGQSGGFKGFSLQNWEITLRKAPTVDTKRNALSGKTELDLPPSMSII
ncbi:hypothetical protein P4576_18280 [Peribacillus frigoritolerans]|nr:hypothetical protein [Peribacillus frigoritolerans]